MSAEAETGSPGSPAPNDPIGAVQGHARLKHGATRDRGARRRIGRTSGV